VRHRACLSAFARRSGAPPAVAPHRPEPHVALSLRPLPSHPEPSRHAVRVGIASVVRGIFRGGNNPHTRSAGSLIARAFAPAFGGIFGSQVYESFVFEFDAVGTSTEVTFASDATCCPGAFYGPVIDNVSIVEATAVPGPNVLIIFGLGVARRKRAA